MVIITCNAPAGEYHFWPGSRLNLGHETCPQDLMWHNEEPETLTKPGSKYSNIHGKDNNRSGFLSAAEFNPVHCEPQIRDRVLRLSTSSSVIFFCLYISTGINPKQHIAALTTKVAASSINVDHDEFRRDNPGHSPRPTIHHCILEQA